MSHKRAFAGQCSRAADRLHAGIKGRWLIKVFYLQKDALIAAGVSQRHLYSDAASGKKDDRPASPHARLAMAAMGKPETNVGALCVELRITRSTLYRHVSPPGELRGEGPASGRTTFSKTRACTHKSSPAVRGAGMSALGGKQS